MTNSDSKYVPLVNHLMSQTFSGGFDNFQFNGVISFQNSVQYNSKTHRIKPADRNFRCLTILMITLPALYTFGMTLIVGCNFNYYIKAAIGVPYLLLFYFTLHFLFKASLTDPGILPSVQ